MKKALLIVSAAVLAACAQFAPERPSPSAPPTRPGSVQQDVYAYALYHGLRLIDGTEEIDWSAKSFGISGGTLSWFDSTEPAGGRRFPCWLKVEIQIEGVAPPAKDASGALATPTPPPTGVKPGPWTLTFDDDPKGHWSLKSSEIGDGGSNKVAPLAAAAFTAMATARPFTAKVVNGTATTCKQPEAVE